MVRISIDCSCVPLFTELPPAHAPRATRVCEVTRARDATRVTCCLTVIGELLHPVDAWPRQPPHLLEWECTHWVSVFVRLVAVRPRVRRVVKLSAPIHGSCDAARRWVGLLCVPPCCARALQSVWMGWPFDARGKD
ncbi:hypothetical protein EON67_05735, partial [archaeon]